ncbi:MAG: hypothetical protein ACLF0G_00005 [Candidatus Brocadiia bacterium]
MAEFHHFGVPTSTKQENETYLEGAKVYITDPESHPYRVEFLRFEADSPLPEAVRTQAHAAFVVDDLDAALAGQNVVIPPFEPMEGLRAAFIQDGAAVIELMQMS